MAGFSEVADGNITAFKARMTKAGLQAETILEIAHSDLSDSLPEGMVSLAEAKSWMKERSLTMSFARPYVLDRKGGICVMPTGRAKETRMPLENCRPDRQVYIGGQRFALRVFRNVWNYQHGEALIEGTDATYEDMVIDSNRWTSITTGWQAKADGGVSHRAQFRRIPSPDLWVEMTPSWQARFTADRSFELRPTPNNP